MNDFDLERFLDEEPEPERRRCANVSITYRTSVSDPLTFKCDTITTGDPYVAARKLLMELEGTAAGHAHRNTALDTGAEPTSELRRATVNAEVDVAGDKHQVELDSTTNTDLTQITAGLIHAAKAELYDWLHARAGI